MIKLNRTTEYSLVALRHMTRKKALDPGSVTSAREIADCYGLPFEIIAKTLQRLKDTDLIISAQGSRGGYTLSRPLSEVTLAEFLQLMERQRSVVACTTHGKAAHGTRSGSCEYQNKCEIRGLMTRLNTRVLNFLSEIRLAELIDEKEPTV